ncbi:MAG: TonB-dependent receptor [Pseudomonadota bacterium]
MIKLRCCMPALAPLMLALPALAGQGVEVADLSLEELSNIKVYSVSKKQERLGDAAASVFVITADDIRRSGASSLGEALRLAPNLQVAQPSGYSFDISARGLNGSNNSVPNKLLVLIDGRSVYSPLFSGVFWDIQEVLLEDVERIEVISGPGGVLWGVNAVNGVISITTRSARATTGGLLAVEGGTRGADASWRQGGATADGAWRVYGKLLDDTHLELASGARVDDQRRHGQVGFRADWERGAERFGLNGNAYRAVAGQPAPGAVSTGGKLALGDVESDGVNLTAHWTHALDDGASVSLQAYLDRTRRDVPPSFSETLDIADFQLLYTAPAIGRHSVVWGANYRRSWDHVTNSTVIAFLPADLVQQWPSVFAQDDIALAENLRLTLGARIERNDYTGKEFLPTVRLAWKPSAAHLFWGGVSRTVRAPSRLDADAFVPGVPPFKLRGGPRVRGEVARVFELGYRGQLAPRLSFSATVFHNQYDHLHTQEVDASRTFAVFDSLMEGSSTGVEMWGSYQALPNWRLSAGLTALRERLTLKPGSNDLAGPGSAGKDPAHQLQLRSSFSLGADQDVDIGVRRVAALANPAVPAYTALDAHFGWRLQRNLELSVTGQNLNGGHAEYGALATRSVIPRSLGVKLVWQW